MWWAWRAYKPKKVMPPGKTGNLFTEISDVVDPFVTKVQAERIAAELQARQEGNQYRSAIEAQVKDNEALKARVSQFAKDNGLDVALAQLWDEMRCYPAWSKRADFVLWNKLKVTDVGESESTAVDIDNKTIWFHYEGVKYTVKTRRWSGMESEPYQDFTLYENDEEVFGVSTSVVSDYVTYYSPTGVTSLKRKGQWATMLVRLFAKLQLENQKSSADYRARNAAEISGKFSE